MPSEDAGGLRVATSGLLGKRGAGGVPLGMVMGHAVYALVAAPGVPMDHERATRAPSGGA
jgi:hypothetical protein